MNHEQDGAGFWSNTGHLGVAWCLRVVVRESRTCLLDLKMINIECRVTGGMDRGEIEVNKRRKREREGYN